MICSFIEFYERVADPALGLADVSSQEEGDADQPQPPQQSPDSESPQPINEVTREEYQRQKAILHYLQVSASDSCSFSVPSL